MTFQRIRAIEQAAGDLLRDVEWMDISPVASPMRSIFADILRKPEFLPGAHDLLSSLFDSIRDTPELADMIGNQEPIDEAASFVQSILKNRMIEASPDSAQALSTLPLSVKFRSLPLPFTHAPRHAGPPPIADQMAMRDRPAPLPFAPESMESLRRRYPAAICDVVNVMDALAGGEIPMPFLDHRHVFDMPDGYRFQIALELYGQTLGKQLHVSAGRIDTLGNPVQPPNIRTDVEKNEEAQRVLERFRQISDFIGEPTIRIVTPVSTQLFFRMS